MKVWDRLNTHLGEDAVPLVNREMKLPAAERTPANVQTSNASAPAQTPAKPRPTMRKPTNDEHAAWRAEALLGLTQDQIALQFKAKGKPVVQGTISRWTAYVRKYHD